MAHHQIVNKNVLKFEISHIIIIIVKTTVFDEKKYHF